MASGSYRQTDVQCPFYRSDDGKQRIVCEGIAADSSLSWSFVYKRDYKIQLEEFCCKKYRNCEIYNVLNQKYEE